MKIISRVPEFTFDDILLLPGVSKFLIEEDEKKCSVKTKVSRNLWLDVPIVSSPMPGVTESSMAIAVGKLGGLGFLHPFQSFGNQLEQVTSVKKQGIKVAASVAVLDHSGLKHIGDLLKLGTDLISIETAHAGNTATYKFIQQVKKKYPRVELNVAVTVDGKVVRDLISLGADSIRVGIGPGSHCTTRLVTGVGRPQLSAIADCYRAAKKWGVPIIAEGGIVHAGDIAKALVFGADAVMIGGLFSGTDESPGPIITRNGRQFKYSWGMCTKKAISELHPSAFSKQAPTRIIKNFIKKMISVSSKAENHTGEFLEEGVANYVPYRGSVVSDMELMVAGLRRSMWYQGVVDIGEMREKARVIFVSSSTNTENQPRI